MAVTQRLQHVATAILMQFLWVFLVWILAERLGLSGIITLVCFAIMVAQIAPIKPMRDYAFHPMRFGRWWSSS